MAWEADVPFDAADVSLCRGCSEPIGWLEVTKKGGKRGAHPVQAKGWVGYTVERRPTDVPYKTGYTRDGHLVTIVQEPPMFETQARTVVFETHFAFCPKAHRFGRRS